MPYLTQLLEFLPPARRGKCLFGVLGGAALSIALVAPVPSWIPKPSYTWYHIAAALLISVLVFDVLWLLHELSRDLNDAIRQEFDRGLLIVYRVVIGGLLIQLLWILMTFLLT